MNNNNKLQSIINRKPVYNYANLSNIFLFKLLFKRLVLFETKSPISMSIV